MEFDRSTEEASPNITINKRFRIVRVRGIFPGSSQSQPPPPPGSSGEVLRRSMVDNHAGESTRFELVYSYHVMKSAFCLCLCCFVCVATSCCILQQIRNCENCYFSVTPQNANIYHKTTTTAPHTLARVERVRMYVIMCDSCLP